uniref:Cytochrome c oxidase assembly factor 6 homolog n=2 Tax=Meleagris gallopavo TaxID=9103 RepID=A0A803YEM0_MELGA
WGLRQPGLCACALCRFRAPDLRGRCGPGREAESRGPRIAAAIMSAPTMEERKACWAARDEFWRCLDGHTEDAPQCEKLRRSFESLCPQQWVKYFDKRRDFLKYKEKLESEGFQSPETTRKS